MTKKADTTALLLEVLSIVRTLVHHQKPPRATTKPLTAESGVRGIYPHQSKYNPWRAYAWDTEGQKTVYLGAFPTVAKAKSAQKAYRMGATVIQAAKGPRIVREVA